MKQYTYYKIPRIFIVIIALLAVLFFLADSNINLLPTYLIGSVFILSLAGLIFYSMVCYSLKDIPRRDKALSGKAVEAEVVESYATRNYVHIRAQCCIKGMNIEYIDRYSTPNDFLEKSDSLLRMNKSKFKPGEKIVVKYQEENLGIFTFLSKEVP